MFNAASMKYRTSISLLGACILYGDAALHHIYRCLQPILAAQLASVTKQGDAVRSKFRDPKGT